MVAYAQQSYRILRELIENPFTAEAKWRALFVTPLTPYDVLIHLESAVGAKGASSKYKNLQLPTKQPVYVGLDLVENYLSELRARFGHLALFFHNALEGRVIGVVWKPGTFAPKPFKVLHTEFAVPVSLLPADSPLVKVRGLPLANGRRERKSADVVAWCDAEAKHSGVGRVQHEEQGAASGDQHLRAAA